MEDDKFCKSSKNLIVDKSISKTHTHIRNNLSQNEIDDKFEYDLRKNYEDLTVEESEEKINLEVPNILVFSIVNNSLYLDPCDEEIIITPSSLFVSEVNKKLLNIESIGDSVEPILYSQIAEIIKTIKAL